MMGGSKEEKEFRRARRSFKRWTTSRSGLNSITWFTTRTQNFPSPTNGQLFWHFWYTTLHKCGHEGLSKIWLYQWNVDPMMRPHTLWTRILDTPWTPAIFPSIFRRISNRYSIISTFSGLFRLLDVRAISHVDRTATATYYQSHRSMLHLYSILPTFSLSYHWRLRYFRLYHMAIDLLLWCITKAMTTT